MLRVELDGVSWFEVGDFGWLEVETSINSGRWVAAVVVRSLEQLKSFQKCRG
jgi:hypothetical protein